MIDPEKHKALVDLICELTPEELESLRKDLFEPAGGPSKLELQLNVMSSDDAVKITFGERVSWIQLTKIQAFQLGCIIIEHAGAKVERTVIPETPQA